MASGVFQKLGRGITPLRNQAVIGLVLMVLAVFAAFAVANKIVVNDMKSVIYAALVFAALVAAVVILRNWRTGFAVFLIWLMFEDFVRKYMGNGLVLFFGKDVLLALVYVSYYVAVQKGRERAFRPPFLFFLSLFFWLGVLQMFNPNSPSIWYGLLGIKVYFFYIPLMFVGYSLIRDDEDLQKFFKANSILAIIVAVVGIFQAILGNSFLNPQHLAPDLVELGDLQKTTASGVVFNLPDSIFVSSGRYAAYLAIAFIVCLGAIGYLLLHTKRNRRMTFIAIGLLGGASLLSGSRGSFLSLLLTSGLLSVGFLWGAPWRWRQAHRMVKAIRRTAVMAVAGLVLIIIIFPEQAGSRMEYYTETLLPSGSDYELSYRTWDYPMLNLSGALANANWRFGNGIGTAALGTQYVARLVGKPAPHIGVEEGFGTLIIEMGIIAPFLWMLWSLSLLYYCWKVVRTLKETRFFPLGFATLWYAALLLFIWTYGSLSGYENYICNAYLWLLVGILFRLPDLAITSSLPAVVKPAGAANPGGLQF